MPTTIKKGNVVPSDLASRWENIVELASQRLFEKRKKVKEAIGSRPYKGLPVSEQEIDERWSEIRTDQESATNLLLENAKIKPDGRVLLPKDMIKTIRDAEERRRKGGYA